MEKQKLEIDFNTPCGNLMFIIGSVYKCLKDEDRLDEFKALQDYALGTTYSQALVEINKYVELVDLGTPKTLAEYLKQGEKLNKEKTNV